MVVFIRKLYHLTFWLDLTSIIFILYRCNIVYRKDNLNFLNMNTTEAKHNIFESTFTWTILNFSSQDNVMQSQENVIIENNRKVEWYLKLWPYNDNKTHTSIYLYVDSQIPIEADYEFTFEDKNGKCLNSEKFNYTFKNDSYRAWGLSEFIKRESILTLTDDTLIIKSWISLKLDNETGNLKYMRSDLHKHMSNNLNELYSSGSLSDVTIETSDGCKFLAHKCILGAHSPVFKSMFEHKMKESQENKVTIEDLDSDIVKTMLEFIYSHEFKKNQEKLSELLIASNRYDIPLLKSMCEIELGQRLTLDNAIDYLILADNHQAQQLKKEALEVIKHNFKIIREKDNFKKSNLTLDLLYDIMFTL